MRITGHLWHRFLCRLLVFTLLFSSLSAVGIRPSEAYAADEAVKTRILEITDSGTSDLSGILGGQTSSVELTTLRMKRFVALREDLDGRYDAIYIGKGTYNPAGLPAYNNTTQNHDTTHLQNDITNLKAKEIIDGFVNKGLPVILHTDVLNQVQTGKLYTMFSPYNKPATAKENVIFVSNTDIASYTAFNAKTKFFERSAVRPRFVLTASPTDYSTNNSFIYQDGDSLTFQFDIKNVTDVAKRGLIANLYLSADQVLSTGAEHLVAWAPVTQQTGNVLSFRLPKGFSGLQYWKLEIVEGTTLTKLKDVKSGLFRFRDEVTKINVLQILPKSSTLLTNLGIDSNSSLKAETNIKQSYLKTTDYVITIDTMSILDFNATGYTTLNGKYDMLIFGFRDEYNTYAPINEQASKAVQTFITTGQAVMFTHDTIYTNSNSANWMNYFQAATGQIEPQTNMGLRAPNTTTTVVKVNEGLLTQFPYALSSGTLINLTHNQYFTLNLEDRAVVPWYNVIGSSRDVTDSWNHYYTYSKGNVTYSGTGHRNTGFPDWEQQLFVNTMFRAYIGSNHAPVISAYAPAVYSSTDNNIIPASQDIYVSYKAEDYDLNDRHLTTSVTFTYNGKTQTVLPAVQKSSGEMVSQGFANPLPDGGNLTITITATDAKGATSVKEIPVKVEKVTANLQLARTISAAKVEKNTTAELSYTITPSPVAYSSSIKESDLIIKGLQVNEVFPANLAVSQLPAGPGTFVKEGTLSGGYTVKGALPDIQYRRSGEQFIADPVSFKISVTPQKNGSYLLDNSKLTFTDFVLNQILNHSVTRTLPFNTFNLDAVTTMTSLELTGKNLRLNDEDRLIPTILPLDTSNKNLTWTSLQPDIVSVSQTGIIKGLKAGQATIRAVSQDGSNLSATAVVNVIIPGLNIIGPANLFVGQSDSMTASLLTANETPTSYKWSVASGGECISLSNTDQASTTITGVKPGTSTVLLTVTTDKGAVYTRESTVTVMAPKLSIIGPTTLYVGEQQALDFRLSEGYENATVYSWTVKDGAGSVQLTNETKPSAVLEGLQKGTATVSLTIATDKGSTYSQDFVVNVEDPSVVITPGERVMNKEETLTLSAAFLPDGLKIPYTVQWTIEEPKSGVVTIIDGAQSLQGLVIKGQKPGTAHVAVTVTTDKGRVYTDRTEISVRGIGISGDSEMYEFETKDFLAIAQSVPGTGSFVNGILNAANSTWSILGGDDVVKLLQVEGQKITIKALKPGQAQIRMGLGVLSATQNITVKPLLESLELPDSLLLSTGTNNTKDLWSLLGAKLVESPEIQLPAGFDYKEARLKGNLIWSSSDPLIAEVNSNGVITAVKNGTADITVSYTDAIGTVYKDTVQVVVGSLLLQGAHEVMEFSTINLTAGFDAANVSTDQLAEIKNGLNFQWSTADDKIASLNALTGSGVLLTGNQPGDTEIVLGSGELSVTHAITVKSALKGLGLPGSYKIKRGAQIDLWKQLEAVLDPSITLPAGMNYKESRLKDRLTWTSSSPNYVSVNKNGVVQALKNGTAKITVKYTDQLGRNIITATLSIIVDTRDRF
ncbi:uncharacterized protein YjdB [Paenibacillus mucilaginosus]|uniref:DUF5057 domain-containing protein n=1 Tax=Paenibacillus mucilaginosus TaxID=61624 RepID=UPI003D1C885C